MSGAITALDPSVRTTCCVDHPASPAGPFRRTTLMLNADAVRVANVAAHWLVGSGDALFVQSMRGAKAAAWPVSGARAGSCMASLIESEAQCTDRLNDAGP